MAKIKKSKRVKGWTEKRNTGDPESTKSLMLQMNEALKNGVKTTVQEINEILKH